MDIHRIGEILLMKKIYKNIIIILVTIYATFTLISQQKTLNEYDKDRENLSKEIQYQKTYKEELAKKKENVDSLEFIEQMAREKLDMYYPNEKIYIDKGI